MRDLIDAGRVKLDCGDSWDSGTWHDDRRRAARGDSFYFNNPADFVTGLDGSPASLLLVAGRGMREDTTGALEQTLRFAALLETKGIRIELDVWGEEAPRDWPARRAQLARHLPRFV